MCSQHKDSKKKNGIVVKEKGKRKKRMKPGGYRVGTRTSRSLHQEHHYLAILTNQRIE